VATCVLAFFIELVLMLLHPDTGSMESDAFGFQAEALFQAIFARERDFAAGSDHSMPRQTACTPERPDHLTGTTGEAGRARDVAIGGDSAPGNFTNSIANYFQHSGLLGSVPG
jgi:hypothetical protein